MSYTSLSIVIPTYQREMVLLETVYHLLNLVAKTAEIIIVTQQSMTLYLINI